MIRLSVLLVHLPVPVAVAVYTVGFGLWLLRRGNVRGAIGVFFIAACCVAAPLIVLAVSG